ncbi:MAG: hypothetical protein L6R41_008182, partial [Letrouitia leprolyta]
ADENDADRRVEGGAGGDGNVVLRGDGPVIEGVCATDVGDRFRVEFGLNAGFTDYEDSALG